MPTSWHVKKEFLGSKRLDEFKNETKQARKLPLPSLQSDSKTPPAQSQGLADVVRKLGEVNVAAAHAKRVEMQSELDATRQAQQHVANVHSSFYSAVDSAVRDRWAAGVDDLRKKFAAKGLGFILGPVPAAIAMNAAKSLKDTAPGDMSTHLCKVLLDSTQGKALREELEKTGEVYGKDKDKPAHSAFEDLLQTTVARYVQHTLEPIEPGLHKQVGADVAASDARDALVWATGQLRLEEDAKEASTRVRNKANEAPTSSGGLPPIWGEGASAKRTRLGDTTPQERSAGAGQGRQGTAPGRDVAPSTQALGQATQPAPTVPASAPEGAGRSRAEESARNLRMPTAPTGPIGGAERRTTGSMDR